MPTNRLESFSDGVFAFAITLLIIAIRLPGEGPWPHLARDLLQLWPSYLAYALSVFVIGAIWINHHGMFQFVGKADRNFLVLNLAALMTVAFIPFPTAVLAETIASGQEMPVAAAFYGLTLVVLGVAMNAMWWYAVRHGLLKADVSPEAVKKRTRRFLVGAPTYAVASLVGLWLPWLALAAFVGLNVFYLWPWRRLPKRQ